MEKIITKGQLLFGIAMLAFGVRKLYLRSAGTDGPWRPLVSRKPFIGMSCRRCFPRGWTQHCGKCPSATIGDCIGTSIPAVRATSASAPRSSGSRGSGNSLRVF